MYEVKLSFIWAYNKRYIQRKFTRLLPNTKLNRQPLNSFGDKTVMDEYITLPEFYEIISRSESTRLISVWLSGIYLLAFASTVFLGPESRGIFNHVLLARRFVSQSDALKSLCVCPVGILLICFLLQTESRTPNMHYAQCTEVQ
jgi:hypothetical protein